MSKAFAIASTAVEHKPAGKMGKAEKVSRAKMLNSMGIPVFQIMVETGVRSRTTVL